MFTSRFAHFSALTSHEKAEWMAAAKDILRPIVQEVEQSLVVGDEWTSETRLKLMRFVIHTVDEQMAAYLVEARLMEKAGAEQLRIMEKASVSALARVQMQLAEANAEIARQKQFLLKPEDSGC